MAVREFIGMRCVPIIGRIGEESFIWDGGAYEHLTIVMTEGGQTYMSRCTVPAGTPLTDTTYWAKFAEFNAQFALLQQTVETYNARITANTEKNATQDTSIQANADAIEGMQGDIDDAADDILALSQTSATHTEQIGAQAESIAQNAQDIATNASDIVTLKSQIDGTSDSGLKTLVDQLSELVDSSLADMAKEIDSNLYLNWLLSEPNFTCVSRFMLGSSENTGAPYYGRSASQGACVFEIDGIKYWLNATSPDNSNHVVITRISDNAVVCDVVMQLGHANGASFDGDHTVMFANNVNNRIVYVDVSDPAYPTVRTTVPTPNNESVVCACYEGDTKKVMLVHGQLLGHNFNVSGATVYTDETLTTVDRNITFAYDSNRFNGWQSVNCDGDYIYIAHSGPETIVVLDMDGVPFANVNMKPFYGHICFNEMESAFVYDKTLYVTNNNSMRMTKRTGYNNPTSLQTADLLAAKIFSESSNNAYYLSAYGMYGSSNLHSFAISDPISLFNNEGNKAYTQALVEPLGSAGPWLFIDDIYAAMAAIGVGGKCAVLNFYSDYPFPILLTDFSGIVQGVNARRKLEGGLYIEYCPNLTIRGNNLSLGNYYRDASTAYPLTCVNSNIRVEDTGSLTMDAQVGTSYQAQFNKSVAIFDGGTPTFTYALVNTLSNIS